MRVTTENLALVARYVQLLIMGLIAGLLAVGVGQELAQYSWPPIEVSASIYTAVFVTVFEVTILWIVWRLRKLLVFVEELSILELREAASEFAHWLQDRIALKRGK